MTIAQLVVQIGADVGTLQKDVGQVHSQLDSVVGMAGKVASALGIAFSVGAVVSFAKEIISFASDMKDLSVQTGIGVERLQALNLVGAQSGVSVDMLASAVAQLSKRLVGGDDAAVGALQLLGLRVQDILAMSPDEAFIRIAEAVSLISNPMERNAIMMELFGKSGAKFLPMVTDELRAMVAEAQRSGAVISKEMIDKADSFDDAFTRMKMSVKGWTMALIEATTASLAMGGMRDEMVLTADMADRLNANVSGVEKSILQATEAAKAFDKFGLQPVKLSMREANKIADELTQSALKKVEQGLKTQQIEAAKAADEHRKLQAILGLGHMKAAQEFVAAMEEIKADLRALNTLVDEVGEKWLTTFGEIVPLAVENGEAKIDAILMDLRRKGIQYTDEQTRTMGETYTAFFSTMEGLFDQFGETFEFVFGPQFAQAMDHMADAMRHGRDMVGGIMRGLSGDFTGFISAAMSAINMLRAAWSALKALFGGGEEGTVVNPARDTFLGQFGPGGTGPGSGFHTLASMLTELGAGEGGGAMFSALTQANTMALFRPAAQMIVDFLRSHGRAAEMNFHSGGMVPGFGEVNARLLGGERVQSRQEVGEMSGMLGEMRGIRADLMRLFDDLPQQMQSAGQRARGRGLSYA